MRNGRVGKAVLHQFTETSPYRVDFNRMEKIRDVANELTLYQDEPGAMRSFTALVPVLDETTLTRPVVDADATDVATLTPSVAQLLAFNPRPRAGPGCEAPGPAALRPGPGGRSVLRPRSGRGSRAVAV